MARPLFALQEITCAAPAYLARHPAPQTPAELSQHQCLLNTHYSGFEQWLYHRQHRLERVPVSGQLASNHYSLLKKAALSGAGIARLPSYMVQDELADGRLQWLLRDYQTRSTPVSSRSLAGSLPRRTQALVDSSCSVASAQPPGAGRPQRLSWRSRPAGSAGAASGAGGRRRCVRARSASARRGGSSKNGAADG